MFCEVANGMLGFQFKYAQQWGVLGKMEWGFTSLIEGDKPLICLPMQMEEG